MRIKKNILKYKNPETGEYTPIPVVATDGVTKNSIEAALGYTPADEGEVTELNEKIVEETNEISVNIVDLNENGRIIFTAKNVNLQKENKDNYVDTGIALDFSHINILRLNNISDKDCYLNPVLMRDGVIVQYLGNQLFTPKSSFIWDNAYYINTENIHMHIQNTDFTTHTWTIGVKNQFGVDATMDIYHYEKQETLKENNIIIVDNNAEYGCFKLLSDACNYARSKIDVQNVPVTILVKNGVYNEVIKPQTLQDNIHNNCAIFKGANKINIIGESRDNVIINVVNTLTLNGIALDIGGDCVVKNLTVNVKQDGSITDNNKDQITHCCYALHNDRYYETQNDYITRVENCKFTSTLFEVVGAGLKDKQTQIYEKVETILTMIDSERGDRGSFYLHNPSTVGHVANGLELIDCNFISTNGAFALQLPSVPGTQQWAEIPIKAQRVITSTTGDMEIWVQFRNNHVMTIDSKLNSNELLNY